MADTTTHFRPADHSDAARIHEIAEAFEIDWQADDWPRMTGHVRQAPPELAPALAEELIAIDIQRRLALDMTLPVLDSYLGHFPDLATDAGWRAKVQAAFPSVPHVPPAHPEKIGRYPVNSLLATGGEAEVYLAFHPDWKKQVVVKWMREASAGRTDWRERFARQGQLLKDLEHDKIVRIYDQGEFQGRPFLVTEYIRGRTLAQYYHDVHPNPAQAVALVADVAVALAHAHRLGVYHQDIKPDNILVDDAGRAKLIDFGVAWFRPAWGGGTDLHGCTAGTLAYFSPEQAAGGEITARTDLFALGGVLYFLLTGVRPYPERQAHAALRRAGLCDWDRTLLSAPGIPVALRRVCETAMAKDPKDRFDSAAALATAARVAVHRSWYRSPRRLAVAAAVLCAVGGFAVIGKNLGDRWFPYSAQVATEKANLLVQVRRPGFDPKPLDEVIPLKDGDSLQARFRVAAGVHAALAYVNGAGQLEVLQSYPAQDQGHEAVWPGPGEGTVLGPPTGTEFLFVCGRTDRVPTAEELQEAWAAGAGWPDMEPTDKFLRVQPGAISVEGSGNRSLKGNVPFPETDPIRRRLEHFRGRLKAFPVLDGVAFRHQ